jgi:hypothetical protein
MLAFAATPSIHLQLSSSTPCPSFSHSISSVLLCHDFPVSFSWRCLYAPKIQNAVVVAYLFGPQHKKLLYLLSVAVLLVVWLLLFAFSRVIHKRQDRNEWCVQRQDWVPTCTPATFYNTRKDPARKIFFDMDCWWLILLVAMRLKTRHEWLRAAVT